MRVRRILVGTDFSPNAQAAIEVAYSLAEQFGAELMVVHVQEDGALRTAIREGLVREESTDTSVAESIAQLTASRLAEALAGFTCGGGPIRKLVRRGDADYEIADCARSVEADLLVVGKAGRSVTEALRTTLVGSVTRNLLQLSPCPVLVVRPDHLNSRRRD